MPDLLKTLLLSLLALVGALVALTLVTNMASWLPTLLGLALGNPAQLGWDLAFTVLGGIAAVAFATWYAPCWPRSHGAGIWTLIALGSGYGVWVLGGDFPSWFVSGLLASLPVQLGLGWYIGGQRRRSATSR
ncbi:hypothetical protein [Stenotrophomonas sp. 24(2023)]|uniref:hypothetical protein n=1 Tax=Stenotrophomonas sp. 24(2023) TaxID=3068324 RepID=UPI0027E0CD13|nr:hypothetical protein [Stenotrophomonas sp. 24(2023)]WMJ71111.1 hypothetical protein Q9R17_08465 [Stenotrophomonas sp. 24(2023)]